MTHNLRKSYSFYKEKNEDTVTLKQYLHIIYLFNKHIISLCLKGYIVKLPSNMGKVFIKCKKPKIKYNENKQPILPVDWKKTRELWEDKPETKNKKYVYFLNMHTDMYRFRFFWSKKNIHASYKNYYSFILSRDNKRLIAKSIKEGKEFLIE